MKRNNLRLIKILVFLFALNSITLYLYFSTHHHHNNNHNNNHKQTVTVNANSVRSTLTVTPPPPTTHLSKPWPILPSYLPWTSPGTTTTPFRSCEAYFGNGFNRRQDLLLTSSGTGGWFRCYYSETLRSSICEGGRIKMNVDKVKMSKGGERIEDVIGRGEDDELPEFEFGAFEIESSVYDKTNRWKRKDEKVKLASEEFLNEFVPRGEISRHAMHDLIGSIRVVGAGELDCDQWIEEPALLVTRYEYANLFHTMTDWYSAYVSSRVTGLPNRPHLVFVDGHCTSPLEETWNALYSGLRYAKNFSGSVCFRHAVLSPLGYETSLFKGLTEEIECQGASAHDLWVNPDDKGTARLSEFGEMIRASFGFSVNRHEKPTSVHNVLFVRREDYLAHPRHKGKVESRLSNELEIFETLQNWASNYQVCKINIVNGLFAHMPMRDQVQAIQDASVIVGAHGAGMTHIISATPKTIILELISSYFRRPHFKLISEWKGLEYHAINLAGSYANPPVVVESLNNIMRSLGC
ncbi:hypothetical protein ACFE04_022459 [Oxalis oulophora]